MEPKKPRRSLFYVLGLAVAVVVAFFAGIVEGGTFWYAVLLWTDNPSTSSTAPARSYRVRGFCRRNMSYRHTHVMLKRRVPLKYPILSFTLGGLIGAIAGIVLISFLAWVSWVGATSG